MFSMDLRPWTSGSQNLAPGNSISGFLPWGSLRDDQGWVMTRGGRGDIPDVSLKLWGASLG